VMRAALALANTLVIALTVGLVISARSREPSRAMYGTFFTLGIAAVVLMLSFWPVTGQAGFAFSSVNPFTPFKRFDDLSYRQFAKEFWLSIFFTASFAALALWRVSARVTVMFAAESEQKIEPGPARTPTGEIADPETALSYVEAVEWRSRTSKRWFEGNPIEWLCLRHLKLQGRESIPAAMAVGVAVLMAFTHFFGFLIYAVAYLIFGFLYSACATATIARARQTGELELWLTTPLAVAEIVKGQVKVMRRTFMWPGLILLLGWCAVFYMTVVVPMRGASGANFSVAVNGSTASSATSAIWPLFYLLGSTVLGTGSLFFVLPYVAMWVALKTKTPAQATMRTFLLMFVAPWILLWIPKVLIFVPIGFVADHSVKKLLKEYGTRGLSGQRG